MHDIIFTMSRDGRKIFGNVAQLNTFVHYMTYFAFKVEQGMKISTGIRLS